MKYLLPPSQKTLADFINGSLWRELRLVLLDRMTPSPDVKDEPHVAAAKGHQRAGAHQMIELMEGLPFETPPPDPQAPFQRPAVAFTQD